jgi:PII-like signaling protein
MTEAVTRPTSARRLMIIVDEDACIGHTPVYTEIVRLAHDTGLAGASVFRGIEGFGSSRLVHTSRILSLAENLPAMIVIIDTPAAIDAFVPRLRELGVRGVVAIDDVELAQPGRIPEAAQS